MREPAEGDVLFGDEGVSFGAFKLDIRHFRTEQARGPSAHVIGSSSEEGYVPKAQELRERVSLHVGAGDAFAVRQETAEGQASHEVQVPAQRVIAEGRAAQAAVLNVAERRGRCDLQVRLCHHAATRVHRVIQRAEHHGQGEGAPLNIFALGCGDALSHVVKKVRKRKGASPVVVESEVEGAPRREAIRERSRAELAQFVDQRGVSSQSPRAIAVVVAKLSEYRHAGVQPSV